MIIISKLMKEKYLQLDVDDDDNNNNHRRRHHRHYNRIIMIIYILKSHLLVISDFLKYILS